MNDGRFLHEKRLEATATTVVSQTLLDGRSQHCLHGPWATLAVDTDWYR